MKKQYEIECKISKNIKKKLNVTKIVNLIEELKFIEVKIKNIRENNRRKEEHKVINETKLIPRPSTDQRGKVSINPRFYLLCK